MRPSPTSKAGEPPCPEWLLGNDIDPGLDTKPKLIAISEGNPENRGGHAVYLNAALTTKWEELR